MGAPTRLPYFVCLLGALLSGALTLGLLGKADAQDPTMAGFRGVVQDLVPFLASKDEFNSPRNHSRLAGRVQQFAALARHPTGVAAKTQDYEAPLRTLQTLTSEAEKAFLHHRKEHARTTLRWAINLCVTCHARLPSKPNTAIDLPLPPIDDPLERGRMQIAFRDFTGAAASFEQVVVRYPGPGIDWYRLVRALDYLATLHVRLERNPQRALRTFEKVLARASLPIFIRDDVAHWVEDLRVWAQQGSFSVAKAADTEVIRYVEGLLKTSEGAPKLLGDRAHAIRYLRASGILHQLLVTRPATAKAAKANYLLGICYMSLDRDVFMGLDTAYLKSCIHAAPRTPVAQQCYSLLEENTFFGYSGSGGTFLPPDVKEDLATLRSLAGVSPPSQQKIQNP